MSHITDGDLHAYLDQALDAYAPVEAERIRGHLESCADCAKRLEAERALRERATGILGAADPGTPSLASLEELKARAAATAGPIDRSSKSRFSWRSPYAIGMGWAATIALALWTGYSVKDFVPNPSGRPPVALEPMRELDAVSANDQGAGPDEKADQFRASRLEAEVSAQMSSAESVRGGAEGAGAPADVVAEAGQDQDLAVDEGRQRLRRANAARPERVDAAVRNEAAPAAQPRPPAPTVFEDSPVNRSRGVAGKVLDARKTLEQEEPQEGAMAVDGMLLITAERGFGGVPPGLEMGRVDVVELPGMGQATLAVYILPDGGDLELWSLTASALAAASPRTDPEDRAAEITAYFRNSLPTGWSMTVQVRPDGYLVARAPLPQAELDALMERVPGGG